MEKSNRQLGIPIQSSGQKMSMPESSAEMVPGDATGPDHLESVY